MPRISFTGDTDADQLLSDDPLALLVGMLLDQQVPMERAFGAPHLLAERLGHLDAARIAAMSPDALEAVFKVKPALHRFPGAMAKRVHTLCQTLVAEYDGDAAGVWRDAATGRELFDRVAALPGFGEQKTRIFIALLAKQLDVTPDGWEEAAGDYALPGHRSVADINGPVDLEQVRQYKRAKKAGKA
jgi:uncharacterized HhH-GPD family protein